MLVKIRAASVHCNYLLSQDRIFDKGQSAVLMSLVVVTWFKEIVVGRFVIAL
jgi:hypothetical protein